jgi:flagellar hook-length control protein FliK
VNSGGKGGDFAVALSKAGAKPARKSVPSEPGNGSTVCGPDGGQLPVAGNPSPPSNTNGASADDVGIDAIGGGASPTTAQAAASTAATDSAQGTQFARAAPDPAAAAPGITFSLDVPAGAGEQGAQGADKAALAGAGSAGATPAGATPAAAMLAGPTLAAATLAAATQDSRVAPTSAFVQELAAANAAGIGRASVSGGASLGIRSTVATGDAAAQANAAASDPTSLGATAAVMVAVTGAFGDNSTTADSTLSTAADSAAPVGSAAAPVGSAAAAAVANGAPGPGFPLVAGRLPAAAATATVAAAPAAALITASAGATGADKHARSDGGDSLPADASAGSAGAAQLSVSSPDAATPGAADIASAPTLKVAAGVDSPEFGQGLADRLSWMVDNNLSGAKLQVNPPQLGPIEVRIALQGDHAQVWLVSHSAVTRDALQSSSPNLREMLGAQGFGQVSVDISQRDFQDRSAHAQPYERTPAAVTASVPAMTVIAASLPRLSRGAVDAYA